MLKKEIVFPRSIKYGIRTSCFDSYHKQTKTFPEICVNLWSWFLSRALLNYSFSSVTRTQYETALRAMLPSLNFTSTFHNMNSALHASSYSVYSSSFLETGHRPSPWCTRLIRDPTTNGPWALGIIDCPFRYTTTHILCEKGPPGIVKYIRPHPSADNSMMLIWSN
jgi:hypothetical protein